MVICLQLHLGKKAKSWATIERLDLSYNKLQEVSQGQGQLQACVFC